MSSSLSSRAYAPGTRSPVRGPYRSAAPTRDQLAQVARLGVARGDGERRQPGCDEVEVERALPSEPGGRLDRPRIALEPQRHLGTRPQVRGRARGQPAGHLVEAPSRADGGERGAETGPRRCGVVDVAGGDDRQPGVGREGGEGVAPLVVGGFAGVG